MCILCAFKDTEHFNYIAKYILSTYNVYRMIVTLWFGSCKCWTWSWWGVHTWSWCIGHTRYNVWCYRDYTWFRWWCLGGGRGWYTSWEWCWVGEVTEWYLAARFLGILYKNTLIWYRGIFLASVKKTFTQLKTLSKHSQL
jgi:hypothetical protein